MNRGALAVLDDLIADMGTTPGTTGAQLAEARDDLRELAKAVGAGREVQTHNGAVLKFDEVQSERLAAALARVEPRS